MGGAMKTIARSSASLKAKRGVVGEVVMQYGGVVGPQEVYDLGERTLGDCMDSPFYIVRLDQAVTLFTGEVVFNPAAFPAGIPPSICIVRPDQAKRALRFCRMLAEHGVRQTCWLPGELQYGLRWALLESQSTPP